MTDAPDIEQTTLHKLLDAEKACPGPPPEASARVFARLSASLGLPVGLDVGAPTVEASPLPTGWLRRALAGFSRRGLATFVVGAAVGATTYGTVQHLRGREALVPPAMVDVTPPPVAVPASPLPHAVIEPDGSAAADKPWQPAVSRARETTPGLRNARDLRLGAERKLIEMARSALARGHVDNALEVLRKHARSYPGGQLAEERESLAVQALVAKGEPARARKRAARFHQRYPHSLFGPVVVEALKSIP